MQIAISEYPCGYKYKLTNISIWGFLFSYIGTSNSDNTCPIHGNKCSRKI